MAMGDLALDGVCHASSVRIGYTLISYVLTSLCPAFRKMLLFEGFLGCFSPSVAPHTRKLWVERGGALTHNPVDFRMANFFLCIGTEDTWLNELRSRSLIVRHAAWVERCAQEGFLLPIAPYTLDDLFEPHKVYLYAAIRDHGTNTTDINQALSKRPLILPSLSDQRYIQESSKEEKPRKRKREDISIDSTDKVDESRIQPPKKKKKRTSLELFKPVLGASIDARAHSIIFPELYDSEGTLVHKMKDEDTAGDIKNPIKQEMDSAGPLEQKALTLMDVLQKKGRRDKRGKVAMRLRFFEGLAETSSGLGAQEKSKPKSLFPLSLTTHAVFWKDMLSRNGEDGTGHVSDRTTRGVNITISKQETGDQIFVDPTACPKILTLRVDELLKAPPVEATTFEVGNIWEGKKFIAFR